MCFETNTFLDYIKIINNWKFVKSELKINKFAKPLYKN